MIIQGLRSEAGVGGVGDELVTVDARGIEAAAVGGSLKSPENYVGYGRIGNLCVTRRLCTGNLCVTRRYNALTSLTFMRFPRVCA